MPLVAADMKAYLKTAVENLDYGTEAEPKSVSIDDILLAIATGVCNEVNDWISETYDTHVHGVAGVQNGTQAVLTGPGIGGTVSGATDVPFVAPPP